MIISGDMNYYCNKNLCGSEIFNIENSKYIKIDTVKKNNQEEIKFKQVFHQDFYPKNLNAIYVSSEKEKYEINFEVFNKEKLVANMKGSAIGTITQEVLLPKDTRLISHPLCVDGMLFDLCGKNSKWGSYPCYYLSNQGHVGNIGILMNNKIKFVKVTQLPDFPSETLFHYQIQCDLRWPIDEPICDFYIHPLYNITYYANIKWKGDEFEYKLQNISTSK